MTISTLHFGISVSTRSLLFDLQNIKGICVTGVFFLATLGQTASWTSLLTPNEITFTQLWQDPHGIQNYLSSALLSVIDTSGATSAMAHVGYPTVLDYNGLAYEGSTGGILPILWKYSPTGSIKGTSNGTSFVTSNTLPLPPTPNSFNITMSQQGLTAAVSCQNRTGQLDATSDPPLQRFATQAEIVVQNKPYYYTAFSALSSIYTDQLAGRTPLDYMALWEAYIQGVVEFIGTALKTDLASSTGPLHGQPPPDMMKSINGTAISTTLGWEYKGAAGFAVLIPSTFVAIATILIVLVTQYHSRGVPVQHVAFDPSNPLVLMAAASAGGMGNTFHGLTNEDVKEGQRKKVKLAQIGGKVGFVQVNTASTA
ncbi:hypothetical protein B0H12DRAFT_1229266 [Mycena haematopus]|nr:hypothetical protein B0H12DRAFT_1229266 [Mycena haematopus]